MHGPATSHLATKVGSATASVAVGKLEPFSMDNEVISVYLEWVELYSVANSVAQDKRVPVFLTMELATMQYLGTYCPPRNRQSSPWTCSWRP